MRFCVINGPNLHLLGTREPEIYGKQTLAQLEKDVSNFAKDLNKDLTIDFFQSNHEGFIIDKITSAMGVYDGIIINPAGYSHTSVSIHDAIKSVSIPAIEVHISNIHGREDFRQTSITATACIGTIAGFGFKGYIYAILALLDIIKNKK